MKLKLLSVCSLICVLFADMTWAAQEVDDQSTTFKKADVAAPFFGDAYDGVDDYSATLAEFKNSKVAAPFFGDAYGYALLPTVGKVGLGKSDGYGQGQVYQAGTVVGFTSLADIPNDFQSGGQAYSQVIFFENKASFDKFTSGNLKLSAKTSAIDIRASAGMKAGTKNTRAGSQGKSGKQSATKYQDGILVFTMAKDGSTYGATVAGHKYLFKPAK